MKMFLSLLIVIGLFNAKIIAVAAERDSEKSYYKILGINPNASHDEIQSAYRKQVKDHHPDLFSTLEEKNRHEEILKSINEAYEVLSDPEARNGYNSKLRADFSENHQAKSTIHSIQDLEMQIARVRVANTENDIISELNKLDEFGGLIYSDYDAFKFFYSAMKSMTEAGKFSYLSTAQVLLSITESWTYAEYLTGENTLDWDSLHTGIIKRLILNGFSLSDVLAMLGKTSATADMSYLHQALGAFRAHAPFPSRMRRPYDIKFLTIGPIFEALFKTKQIATYEQYVTTVAVMKEAVKGLDLDHPLRYSLRDKVQYVIPFVEKMNFSELLDLTYMVDLNPIEELAVMETILETQHQTNRLTPIELGMLLVNLIGNAFTSGSFNEISFAGYGLSEMSKYVAMHRGYDVTYLRKAVGNHEDPDIIRDRVLSSFLKSDIVDLLTRYKDLISKLNLSGDDWQKIEHDLNMFFGSGVKLEKMRLTYFASKQITAENIFLRFRHALGVQSLYKARASWTSFLPRITFAPPPPRPQIAVTQKALPIPLHFRCERLF